MKNFIEKVSLIQRTLKAPKGQYNSFGKYSYRNCEDILEAVKPLLDGLVLTIRDDLHFIGDRVYIKAIASITDGENTLDAHAYAKEPLTAKGMSDPQISGSASSYARKYALNGLFCIDDAKDDDTKDNTYRQPRNYLEENQIKQHIKSLLGELTLHMTPKEKGQYLIDHVDVRSFKELDRMNSDELKDIEAGLLELKGKA